MEEIDKTIAEFKMQNQIDDYLHKNIYPDFSIKRNVNHSSGNKKKDTDFTDIIYNIDVPLEKLNKHDFMNFESISRKIENLENDINNIQEENIINENICPICIEPIGNKSYFMTKCNHPICGPCCYNNFTKNENTGLLCPICRSEIYNN
uniref:RING-type domain-containing protein n=1 Tax=viral metagenome TaxID=1070528 RepID=A0A6C0EHZ5_9ZZZZ